MYFQKYFASRSKKLTSFKSHLKHSLPCYIRYYTAARVVTSTYDLHITL